VILTPHVGGSTVEAQSNLGIEVSEKLRDYLLSGRGAWQRQPARLSAAPLRSASRLVHLHHDRPGVMSGLNGVLAEAGLNVAQLHLATGAGMGAALIDLSATPDAATLQRVARVEGSVRSFMTGVKTQG
jgi:D-3-phosphoglycerate dehydrogenase